MDALSELMSEKTVIMISHQLKTIQDVDNVLVLRKGRIVQHGPPSRVFFESDIFAPCPATGSQRFVA